MFKTLIAAALASTLLASGAAMAQTAPPQRLMTISGHGDTKAAPDKAVVDLGVIAQGVTAKEALEVNTKNMTALFKMLADAGIEKTDIQTSNFNVGPRYEYVQDNSRAPKIIGYDVNNNVSVKVRKLAALGEILDQAVTAGANSVNGVNFTISNPQAAQDEARTSAVADALRKANLLAKAAGVKLGAIQNISESGGMVQPMYANAQVMMAKSAGEADAVPMAQGQMVVGADVSITWVIE